jgi:hypothetical protein
MSRRVVADPANVAIAAAVAVAAGILGAWWLLLVAVAAYAGLTAMTMREPRPPAARGATGPPVAAGYDVGLSEPIARRMRAGRAAADAIRAASEEAGVPLRDVAADVAQLRAAMESLAARADAVLRYLAEHDPDAMRARMAVEAASDDTVHGRLAEALGTQVAALERLRGQLDRLLSELDHVVVVLQAMQAEVLGMAAAADGWAGRELSSRVGDLHVQVSAMGEGLDEVYGETRVSVSGPPRAG